MSGCPIFDVYVKIFESMGHYLEVHTEFGPHYVPVHVVNSPTYINLPAGKITPDHPEFPALAVRVENYVKGTPNSIEYKRGDPPLKST